MTFSNPNSLYKSHISSGVWCAQKALWGQSQPQEAHVHGQEARGPHNTARPRVRMHGRQASFLASWHLSPECILQKQGHPEVLDPLISCGG